MYKPILLGISNADPWVIYPVLLVLILGLLSIAGIIVFFTGFYIRKLLILICNYSMKNKQKQARMKNDTV